MLALYCGDTEQLQRLRRALLVSDAVLATDRWESFERAVPFAECSVVSVDCVLGDDAACTRLSSLRSRLPLHPVVLVTRRDADNVRCLVHVPVDEIVWPSEVARGLQSAVQRARTRGLLRRYAAAFTAMEHLPPDLRQALAQACQCEVPVRSVGALARMAGRDRSTMWRHWREAIDGGVAVRLEDALHWLVLLRAVCRKTPDRAWVAVARDLGVHEHTLARSARRLAGRSLCDLGASSLPALSATFATKVLRPLSGGDNAVNA